MDETRIHSELKPIIDTYTQLEEELLKNIASIIQSGNIEGGSFEWYTYKLTQLGALNKANLKAIGRHTGKIQKQLEKAFKSIGYGKILEDDKAYNAAYKKGLLPTKPESAYLSKTLQDIFITQLTHAYDKLNLTNTTALETSQQAFLDAVNSCYIEVTTGAYDYNTALRKAMKTLGAKGITGATYNRPDSDKTIKYPLDSAVRRNLMTTSNQMTWEMQFERMNQWGSDLIEISSHLGARPRCAPYQGHIYSVSGRHRKYPALSTTSYGEPAGIDGINCGHTMYPFIEGISKQTYFPYPEEQNNKVYEESQKQRRLEVKVRKLKRLILTADGEIAKQYGIKLKQAERNLKDFMNDTGRKQQTRTSVVGFGHSEAMKAVWADRKTLTDTDKYAINKYISSESYVINEKLRNGDKFTDSEQKFVNDLDKALLKMPKYEGELSRSIYLQKNNLDNFLSMHQPNNKVVYKPYTSFTKGDLYDENANIQLFIKSKNARDISNINQSEAEVIYERNSIFIIDNVVKRNNTYYILLLEVKNNNEK